MFKQTRTAELGGGPERRCPGDSSVSGRIFVIHDAVTLDPQPAKRPARDLQIPQHRRFDLAKIAANIVAAGNCLKLLQAPIQTTAPDLLLELQRSLEIATSQQIDLTRTELVSANRAHELVGFPGIHFFHACEMAHRVQIRTRREFAREYGLANRWTHFREQSKPHSNPSRRAIKPCRDLNRAHAETPFEFIDAAGLLQQMQ